MFLCIWIKLIVSIHFILYFVLFALLYFSYLYFSFLVFPEYSYLLKHRIMVNTEDFGSSNRGSIPLASTNQH